MAETYCGKSCADCLQKEQLACPGCKSGPGRQFSGDCELAQCVKSKGHETCDTCAFHSGCGILRCRDRMPENRKKKNEAERQRKAAIAKRAPVLGKWLWILFWLIIPSTIASLMANDTAAEFFPVLYMPGQILKAIVSAGYGLILLKLSPEEDRYRTAGLCGLVACVVSLGVAIITGTAEEPTWTLVITLPASIVTLVGEYNEYTAHAAVLTGVDNALSEKWEKLWKWHIGLLGAMLGSLLLLIIVPFLGVLLILGAAIGVIVASILKLVYLYQTANRFRGYPVWENGHEREA